MKRRDLIAAIGSTLISGLPLDLRSEPSIPIIAVLVGGSENSSTKYRNRFADGIRKFGYIDSKTVDIRYFYANGNAFAIPGLAQQAVSLNPRVIVCGTNDGTAAARAKTSTIPIVSVVLTDPVQFGLIANFANPSSNVTGILNSLDTTPAKQLELGSDLTLQSNNIGVVSNTNSPGNLTYRDKVIVDIAKSGRRSVDIELNDPDAIESVFRGARDQNLDFLLLLQDYLFLAHRQKIAQVALKYKTPTIYGFREHVEAGGLASYGADLGASWHRAAAFVDKILKGAHAGGLPVEFPTKMETSINMKTAYSLGLEIRSSIMARADNLIE